MVSDPSWLNQGIETSEANWRMTFHTPECSSLTQKSDESSSAREFTVDRHDCRRCRDRVCKKQRSRTCFDGRGRGYRASLPAKSHTVLLGPRKCSEGVECVESRLLINRYQPTWRLTTGNFEAVPERTMLIQAGQFTHGDLQRTLVDCWPEICRGLRI